MNAVGRLLARHLHNIPAGTLEWIGVRPARKVAMISLPEVCAIAELGLEGDRRCESRSGSARQVTLINREHITLISGLLGKESISPDTLRRNLVVSGINLLALRHQRFRIGDVVFEGTALCHPCLRMEQALGQGAVAAMLGHGGLCAKIITTGTLRLGDKVEKIENADQT